MRKERQCTWDILQLSSGEELLVGPCPVATATHASDIAPATVVVDDIAD